MTEIRSGYQAALTQQGIRAEETGNVDSVSGDQRVELEFEQPYLAHACMEPMNFTVALGDGTAEVWGPSQAQSFVQNTVSRVAGIEPDQVKVNTTFLGGGFGRRSAQDFVEAAAEIALAIGRPVKLVDDRGVDSQAVEGLANLPYNIPNRRIDWVNHDPGGSSGALLACSRGIT